MWRQRTLDFDERRTVCTVPCRVDAAHCPCRCRSVCAGASPPSKPSPPCSSNPAPGHRQRTSHSLWKGIAKLQKPIPLRSSKPPNGGRGTYDETVSPEDHWERDNIDACGVVPLGFEARPFCAPFATSWLVLSLTTAAIGPKGGTRGPRSQRRHPRQASRAPTQRAYHADEHADERPRTPFGPANQRLPCVCVCVCV